MAAVLLNGKEISQDIKTDLITRVQSFQKLYDRKPRFFLYQIGDNQESLKHLARKVRLAESIGISAHLSVENENVDPMAFIERINSEAVLDTDVDAILVQLPLPSLLQSKQREILNSIPHYKDVDGLCTVNEEALHEATKAQNADLLKSNVIPCTPLGVLELVNYANKKLGNSISGSKVVVVGRSKLVGKPSAELFKLHGGNVTVCHSETSKSDLISSCKQADIVISACGVPGVITADMVSENSVVIDVGLTWVEGSGLIGDVAFSTVSEKCAAISPVPGGVGPMTMIMLMANVVRCAELHEDVKKGV